MYVTTGDKAIAYVSLASFPALRRHDLATCARPFEAPVPPPPPPKISGFTLHGVNVVNFNVIQSAVHIRFCNWDCRHLVSE